MTSPPDRVSSEATVRFPTLHTLIAVVLTVAVFAWMVWQVNHGMRSSQRTELEIESFEALRGEIMRLDEVLTMSARMGAATGDGRWRERYDRAAPELDAALRECAALAPLEAIAESAARIEAANSVLVSMETRAFALADQGRLDEAQAVLSAREYEDQKRNYAESMTRLMSEVQAWRVTVIEAERDDAGYALAGALLVLALSLVVWSIVLRRVNRWRVDLLSAVGERRAAEAALREANDALEARVRQRTSEVEAVNAKLRTMSGSAQDAIVMIDALGVVSFWNPAAARMFGWSEEEMLGRNLHQTIAPVEFHAAHHEAFARFQRTGEGAALGKLVELRARRKDGSEFPVELSIAPVRESDSWHAVGTIRDITVRTRATEALHEARERTERANSKLEAALARANDLALDAQAANIAKGQFLANMSHEIRTPMNGVIGMTGLLLATELSEEQRRFAEIVRSSGEALLGVVNDILDFSKIEAGKMELEVLDFDLRATLEDTADLLAVRAHEKGLEFICRIDPELHAFLQGDPGRLRQVLVNLAGNAIKFTAQGEVAIEVGLVSETADTITARFAVRDTGIGIPAHKIGVLFKAFQQVDASTTRRFGGTGLGLAISKRIVEMLGGEIGVESGEGRGSTFWFTAVFGKQPRDRGEGAPRADVRGVSILAVDDNVTNRHVLAEQFASWGMRHAEAESAAKALEMLRAARVAGDPFRIALLDMQMPEIDGEALGTTIKADPELRDTLLVMMTSMGSRGDAKRLKAVGFSAYLTKPVKQSQLYDCLAMVLGASVEAAEGGGVKAPLVTRHTISEARRHGVRILVADDNVVNQQVAQRVLEKLGFRADVVANGLEAIRALELAPYHVVFMDVQMPEMDGLEATRAIRSGKTKVRDPRIPIIAMTAHAMKGDREQCIAAGMDDYVPKPIAPQALSAAIERWLDRGQELPLAPPAPVRKTDPFQAVPVFDRPALCARLMDDEDLVREIIEGFLADVPRQVSELKRHVDAGDVRSAAGQAHGIKGAAANVGGMALSAVAQAMEKAGNASRAQEVAALVPELERQLDLLREEMLRSAS